MRKGPYYSIRMGRHAEGGRMSLGMAKKQLLSVYHDLQERGHFQEAFGLECVDAGYTDWSPETMRIEQPRGPK
jgi:hypothetical protein